MGMRRNGVVFKFSWLASLFLAEREARRESGAQPLRDEPKMQLSMRAETGGRHDALRAG